MSCPNGHDTPRPQECRWCDMATNKDKRYLRIFFPEPSILQKAWNLAGAVVSHIRAGLPVVTEEVLAERLAQCGKCEHYNPRRDSCSLCGCKISLKASWAEQDCPDGRWCITTTEENKPEG